MSWNFRRSPWSFKNTTPIQSTLCVVINERTFPVFCTFWHFYTLEEKKTKKGNFLCCCLIEDVPLDFGTCCGLYLNETVYFSFGWRRQTFLINHTSVLWEFIQSRSSVRRKLCTVYKENDGFLFAHASCHEWPYRDLMYEKLFSECCFYFSAAGVQNAGWEEAKRKAIYYWCAQDFISRT